MPFRGGCDGNRRGRSHSCRRCEPAALLLRRNLQRRQRRTRRLAPRDSAPRSRRSSAVQRRRPALRLWCVRSQQLCLLLLRQWRNALLRTRAKAWLLLVCRGHCQSASASPSLLLLLLRVRRLSSLLLILLHCAPLSQLSESNPKQKKKKERRRKRVRAHVVEGVGSRCRRLRRERRPFLALF